MGQFIQSVTSLLESLHYCWLHLPPRKRLSETLNEHHNEVGTAASILHYCSRDQTQWPHFPACLGRALSVHSPDFLCLWGWWEWRCAHLGFAVSHESFLGLIVLIDSFTESENTFSVQRVSELRGEDFETVWRWMSSVTRSPCRSKQRLDWTLGGWDDCTNYSALVFERSPKQSSGRNGIHSAHLSVIAEGVCYCCDDLS